MLTLNRFLQNSCQYFRCSFLIAALLSHTSEAVAQEETEKPFPAILDGMVPIFQETFDKALNRYDGRNGLWSTLPRRRTLVTNAEEAVFLDRGVLDPVFDAALPDLHALTDHGLSLRTTALPREAKAGLGEYLQETGKGAFASNIKYLTSQINTHETWAQTYGYFEIEARLPRGKGRWPAFWLTFAGRGWPPEIDVFEAYGAGISRSTDRDHTFNNAVFFDALDADLEPTHRVDIENTFAGDEEGRTPITKPLGQGELKLFRQKHNALTLEANIYDEFNVFAALWTPDHITFFFGPSSDALKPIFKTPTPDDLHSPMYLIANDQFTARGGWWSPVRSELNRVLDPENDFEIKKISVLSFLPENILDLASGASAYDHGDSQIFDTNGNDSIVSGAGFDVINLTGGSDEIWVSSGRHNKIVSGFGPDDMLTLEGFPFVDGEDALQRLSQVGQDVWLSKGADPFWPQTIIFRDRKVSQFSSEQFRSIWPVPRDHWQADASRPNVPQIDESGSGRLASTPDGSWLSDRLGPLAMLGGPSDDRFTMTKSSTRIFEPSNSGLDQLILWTSVTVPPHLEHIIVREDGVIVRGHSNGQRFDVEANGVTLHGGHGDDLFVFSPQAVGGKLMIDASSGHDRLRGFSNDDQIFFDESLLANRNSWLLSERSDGTLISFSADHSLFVEEMPIEELQARFEAY